MQALPISRIHEARTVANNEHYTRVRADGKLVFPIWPTLKGSAPKADKAVNLNAESPPGEPISTGTTRSFGLRHKLSGTGWNLRRTEAKQSKRRKASVPEASSSPMTTVQETCLDSPTIPRHLLNETLRPGIDRSMSFPDDASNRHCDDLTPRAADFPNEERATELGLPSTGSPGHEVQRRSWLMVSKELKPLIIPSTYDGKPKSTVHQLIDPGDAGDLPPKVPPKSPRTESRVSPRANNRTPRSAKSSVSTVHSATSIKSNSSFSPWNDNHSPQRLRTPLQNQSPPGNLKGLENVVGRTEPLASRNNISSGQPKLVENLAFRTPTYSRDNSPTTKLRSRKHLDKAAPPTIRSNTSPVIPSGPFEPQSSPSPTKDKMLIGAPEAARPLRTGSKHHRGKSEPTNIDATHKRPSLGRADITSIYGLLQNMVKSPTHQDGHMHLPSGFKAVDATAYVPPAEAQALKQQAGEQIEKFEVLQGKDVAILSQELELLDERCSYLHSTHRSLREGRRNLHTRMLTYLKSPRMAKLSRDSILKQEEALAELDISIDDWVSKLEAAEERRTRIRQRLLEHIAAAVTMQTSGQSTEAKIEQPTPPISPDEDDNDYIRTERRDVQSIKIYADEGVAALLAEIEKEIDFMAESGMGV